MTAKPHLLIEERIARWMMNESNDYVSDLLAEAMRECIELRKAVKMLLDSARVESEAHQELARLREAAIFYAGDSQCSQTSDGPHADCGCSWCRLMRLARNVPTAPCD